MAQFIAYSIGVFLIVILLLVIILLVAKKYLSPSGNVNIVINGDRTISVAQGNSLMATLNENGVFLPSACGGKASCGQCKVQVLEGGGEILDSEKPHFSRKEIKAGWRLGCQCKVKGDLKIHVDESILGVKEYECTVISNKNVATFIKEFKVQLPAGEHMDFLPGSYAQIKIPAFDCIDYDKDFDKSLIGDEYLPSWEKFGLFPLKCKNPEPTIRAYSMANYPAEGDVFMLTVRIATPPFKPDRSGFMDVNPGIASSYIFSLKPGDKVIMSGPFGDFHPHFDSKKEMIWCRYGSVACSDHAYDKDTAHHRSRDALLLWCSCPERGVLSRGLPGLGEGIPQLPFPLGSRSSRSRCRCCRREVYSRFRTPGDAEHLPEGSRGSRGCGVLHVWSWPDVSSCRLDAGQPRRRSRVDHVRQFRRLICNIIHNNPCFNSSRDYYFIPSPQAKVVYFC